jgi:hypothetical protein
MAITGRGTGLKGVEEELLEYWLERFARPIEEWSQNSPRGTGLGLATGIDSIGDGRFARLHKATRVSYLNQYLTALGTAVPENPAAFRSAS